MIFGANPEAPAVTPETKVRTARKRTAPPVYLAMNYFMYHPKTKMYQVFDTVDKAILGRYAKRSLDAGMTLIDIKKIIDRFYATPYGAVPHPAFPFVNNHFQRSLTDGITLVPRDVQGEFVANGFERTDDMDLPWSAEYDNEIKRLCLRDPENMWGILESYQ